MVDFEMKWNVYPEIPLSIQNDKLRVEWYNADEGYNGDYDPEYPNDVNLLRFDAYYRPGADDPADTIDGWAAIEDASYCTQMPADAPADILERSLLHIFHEYNAVIDSIPYSSVKSLGEHLSWISDKDFKKR